MNVSDFNPKMKTNVNGCRHGKADQEITLSTNNQKVKSRSNSFENNVEKWIEMKVEGHLVAIFSPK